MTFRIAVVGPESTGKTTLAEALGARLGAAVVPEVARDLLPALGRPYVEADLADVARAQRRAEDATPAPLVADTNLLVVRVWAEVRFGRVDPWILAHERLETYTLHLLCAPDLPWEPDPLREDPHRRPALFARYEAALRAAGVPFAVVRGHGASRVEAAFAACARAGSGGIG